MSIQPKVSVIIPVYNAEKYLRECLDSVVNQTLKEIEIICVDDGSTDNSLGILREYETKDGRVKVLQQKNQYAGVARNNGMAAAYGEYYMFLDADDFFEPELLEAQYERCKSIEADVSVCGADIYDVRTGCFSPAPWICAKKYAIRNDPFSVKEIGDDIYTVTTPSPWNLMFSAAFVKMKNLQFQALQRTNDLYFVWCALNLAERIICLDRVLVHYRVGDTESLQANNRKSPMDFCHAMAAVKRRLQEERGFALAENGFICEAMRTCEYNLRSLKNSDDDAYRYLAKKLREEYLAEFGIKGKPAAYFGNAKEYTSLMEMLDATNEVKVSVVIPVYNVEKYLAECLDSVIGQTLRAIEIVCVDDGSTDGSRKIMEEYAARDQRIKLVNKDQNEGLLRARKDGVAAASGVYIMFLDSDDYLSPNACERAYALIEEKQTDILQFTSGVKDHGNNEIAKRWLEKTLTPEETKLSGDQILDAFYLTRRYTTVLWGKIYRAELCGAVYANIPDFHCYVGEDIYQQFYFGFFANKFEGVQTEPLYWYRWGLGVSNAEMISLSKYELYCKMSTLVENIGTFLLEKRCMEQYQKHHDAMSVRMMEDCCRKYKEKLCEADKRAGGKLLLQYWGKASVADDVFRKSLGVSRDQFAEQQLDVLRYPTGKGLFEGSSCVSVIVPVYNVERYLRECLDSLLNQTLQNVEIICVDDGSTDNSAAVLEEYRLKDSRIRIITQKNAGVSTARNAGLAAATGEYLLFMDSDDYLEEDAARKLVGLCRENDLDVLFFDLIAFYDETEKERPPRLRRKSYERVYDGVSLLHKQREDKSYITSPCLMMLRREFLEENGITFYPGIIHEDELFCFRVLMEAKRTAFVEWKLYHRRVRENSIMTTPKSAKNVMGYFTCLREMMKYGMEKDWGPEKNAAVFYSFERMRWATKNNYDQISDEEKLKLTFTDEFSRILFERIVMGESIAAPVAATAAVTNQAASQRERMLEMKNRMLAQEIRDIHNSATYKIGRFITWAPRKVRGFLRCYEEHGWRYTWERILVHLGLKEDPYKAKPVVTAKKSAEKTVKKPLEKAAEIKAAPVLIREEKYRQQLVSWYKQRTGKNLDLDNPRTFNEKIQWMKLYDSTPIKTLLADKYLAREWIKEKVGEEHLVPLIGIWDRFDDIDFAKLPDRFALKANHGSGWNIVVSDRAEFDIEDGKKKFDHWMGINYGLLTGLELHYMNIPPKIIAEEYLENAAGLVDYRFYCFNGKPQQVWVDIFSGTPRHLRSVFDMEWNPLPLKCTWPEGGDLLSKKPESFEKMKEFAALLSKEFAFVRVDFFEVDGKLYVGEMTFTPMNGTGSFEPEEWDLTLGDMLTLPPKSPIPEKLF